MFLPCEYTGSSQSRGLVDRYGTMTFTCALLFTIGCLHRRTKAGTSKVVLHEVP